MSKRRNLIQPSQVAAAAEKKEKENMRFRSFLKSHADPYELDLQFKELHKMIFPLYNCNRCRNCCKLLAAQIPEEDIDRDAAFLNMSREEFIDKYLEHADFGEWIEKHSPCGFLTEAGECTLGECCPENCKKFPYTDQPDRLESLYSVLAAVSVCPAAYEIFEALKELYGFAAYKRSLRNKRYQQKVGFPFRDDPFPPMSSDMPCEEDKEETDLEELPF